MLVLDTDDLPPAERTDALQTAFDEVASPSCAEFEDAPDEAHARIDLWDLGQCQVIRTRASGFHLSRSAEQARVDPPVPMVVLAMQVRGRGDLRRDGDDRTLDSGDMALVDLSLPYRFGWSGTGACYGLRCSYDRLGLPVDIVHRAGRRLPTSHLYNLVHDHVQAVTASADELAADPGASALGAATSDLLRAVIVSAAQDSGDSHDSEEAQLTDVLAYVRNHLAEYDLTPRAIATAHSFSVRHLYKICEHAGISLEQWIITQRLERARQDLATVVGRQRPISAVARAWCFNDASHFSRRFRQAYGISPRDWQHAST